MDTMLFALTLLLSITGMHGAVTFDKHPAAVPIYIFTARAESGPPGEDEQGRLDSVRDLRDALSHRSEVVLVDSADAARVTVEVIGRERREGGQGGFGGKGVTNFGDAIVRLRIKAGTEETEIKGMAPGYWSRAAKDAADRFIKWIVRYRSRS
jgi:hypothetical protein